VTDTGSLNLLMAAGPEGGDLATEKAESDLPILIHKLIKPALLTTSFLLATFLPLIPAPQAARVRHFSRVASVRGSQWLAPPR
jgi:hypothetical protein